MVKAKNKSKALVPVEPEVVHHNGRRAKKEEFSGMPNSELIGAANLFIEAEEVVHEKKKLVEIAAERIIRILSQEKRHSVIIECNDNRAYGFFTDQGKVKLKKIEVRSPSDKTGKGRSERL